MRRLKWTRQDDAQLDVICAKHDPLVFHSDTLTLGQSTFAILQLDNEAYPFSEDEWAALLETVRWDIAEETRVGLIVRGVVDSLKSMGLASSSEAEMDAIVRLTEAIRETMDVRDNEKIAVSEPLFARVVDQRSRTLLEDAMFESHRAAFDEAVGLPHHPPIRLAAGVS